jgi:hypothetical protein
MISIVNTLHFLDIKLIGSFYVFCIVVFAKYHEYRQPSIFCHARLKSILERNNSSKIDRIVVRWKLADCIWNEQRRWEKCVIYWWEKIWNKICKFSCHTKCHARFFDFFGTLLSYTRTDYDDTPIISCTHCSQVLVKISKSEDLPIVRKRKDFANMFRKILLGKNVMRDYHVQNRLKSKVKIVTLYFIWLVYLRCYQRSCEWTIV